MDTMPAGFDAWLTEDPSTVQTAEDYDMEGRRENAFDALESASKEAEKAVDRFLECLEEAKSCGMVLTKKVLVKPGLVDRQTRTSLISMDPEDYVSEEIGDVVRALKSGMVEYE